ncbi:hypothetical protein OOZ63_08955 [Paucibacter sp. PLA-PC-4]|uniref:hypothetical protein n=1 Tax=Paucibacter sp. PLA-PC-4 TaxID=2993655 RepID=UPI002248ADDD|nr:hypothetical protein [Paucibacter sp. PLA-PC-4]MCX2861966.1 hypothetical protein [Paucibacter sp. PLA-PC-4]
MKPHYLGMRPPDDLQHIPPKYWPHHEYCFYLHDQIGELLVQYEASGAHQWVADAIAKAATETGRQGELDVLDLLKEAGLTEAVKHVLIGHLVLALTADMLHFLYEGMRCLEKRKFAVAFSLLRKPFKENMLFLAWLLADPEDFLARFEKDNYSSLNGLQPARRQEIFKLAADKLAMKEAFDGNLIEQWVFSKEMENGLEPLWQKATHLITSQGRHLRTEDLNINFIFNDARSDHLYDAAYTMLPYLMLFLVQLSLRAFSEIAHANVATANHLVLVSLCAHENLLSRGPRPSTRFITKALKSMLTCLHCKRPFKFDRANAMSLFLTERASCSACGVDSPAPLYWLLAQSDLKFIDDQPPSAFDKLMSEIHQKAEDPSTEKLSAEPKPAPAPPPPDRRTKQKPSPT